MSEVSPETQALIDSLSRLDPSNPCHDRAAIEQAISEHLTALGLPVRPFVWMPDALAGYRYVLDAVTKAVQEAAPPYGWRRKLAAARDPVVPAAARAFQDEAMNAAMDAARDGRLRDGADASWSAIETYARDLARSSAHNEAQLAALLAGEDAGSVEEASIDAGIEAGWGKVKEIAWNLLENAGLEPALHPTRNDEIATAAVDDAAHEAFWRAVHPEIWNAVSRGRYDVWEAWFAIGMINALTIANDPSLSKFKRAWFPLVEAFASGLFIFWIKPNEVVCVLRPVLSVMVGRLHCADGPALWWPSGEILHFWRGVRVPGWIIEESGRLSVRAIRNEPNQELRRCMTEIYGRSRYLQDSGARLVHADEFGRLWEAEGAEGERWRFVEVENGTPEPDGSRRIYALDVTGAEEELGWPIDTAWAAVAATYGLRPEEYGPEVRT